MFRWAASGGSTYGGSIEHGLLSAWNYLTDADTAPEDAQDALNGSYGSPEASPGWIVTDFTGTFELRKLQWRLSRAPSGGMVEDQDVMTFHFIKATGGTPGTYVDGTDLPAVESALGTYWGSLKPDRSPTMHSDQYRWYKDGPAFYTLNDDGTAFVPIGGNAAIRVTEVDVAGTLGGASAVLPPQVALSITEKTSRRSSWGRWYLPAFAASIVNADGRLGTTDVDAQAGYAVTFYNACRAAHMVPVVWSIPKPVRPKKPSGTLPAQAGIAYEVLSIQVDDLIDVIRRRRYDHPTYRKITALT